MESGKVGPTNSNSIAMAGNREVSVGEEPALPISYGNGQESGVPVEQLTPSGSPLDHMAHEPESGKTLAKDQSDALKGMPETFLHGSMKVSIFEGKKLPNKDPFSGLISKFLKGCSAPCTKGGMEMKVVTSDPYTAVYLGPARVVRTRVVHNTTAPHWNEHFTFPVAHSLKSVDFVIKDSDIVGAQYIGKAFVPADRVASGNKVSGWFDVLNSDGEPVKAGAQIRIEIEFTPFSEENREGRGVGGGQPEFEGVKLAYFPMRKGGRVTLYQDSHIADDFRPDIRLENGQLYEPQRCWEDITRTILGATKVIYVGGWSVYTKIKLMRDPARPTPPGGDLILGELLKKRAKEGIQVLVLVWDDATSVSNVLMSTGGLMGTFDEDTKKFFRGTKVRCVKMPRYPDEKLSWFRQKLVGTIYTHHQKFVIADEEPLGGLAKRPLVAYLGGIDLCGGRYDDQHHSLFRKIHSPQFVDDFHQNNLKVTLESGGPRQPWHDLHCKVEGPAAWDALTNFEQRWRRAVRFKKERVRSHDLRLLHSSEDILKPAGDHPGTERMGPAPSSSDQSVMITALDDPETWNVQILRSIDTGSVRGFPSKADQWATEHLMGDKGVAVDRSIHEAYVRAIRRAQHFIYIENQYFLGSSFAWSEFSTAGANSLIPIELALKAASKIRAGEPFSIYIVVPMWPEGATSGGSTQAILYWQTLTMRMMYKIIADAIQEMGLQGVHPTDYLAFYCLGNRETRGPDEPVPEKPPSPDTPEGKAQAARRQMIYVHAKMMVVDDEYVIVGSANINQRSMDGTRDSELAMGAYQPAHTWATRGGQPRGQVFGYRMSLWAEHLGVLEPVFTSPGTNECMRAVNASARARWLQYCAEEVTDLNGHLLAYPLAIGENGSVESLPDYEEFPDLGGKILGKPQRLPEDLTT